MLRAVSSSPSSDLTGARSGRSEFESEHVEMMPRWAGFDRVEFLTAQPHHAARYMVGDRAIVLAAVADATD